MHFLSGDFYEKTDFQLVFDAVYRNKLLELKSKPISIAEGENTFLCINSKNVIKQKTSVHNFIHVMNTRYGTDA